MRTVELWNRLVGLKHPTVRSLLTAASADTARAVFAHDETLRCLAPNILFEIGLLDRCSDMSKVTNVILVLFGSYFLAPTNAGIVMTDLRGLRWGTLELPCDAQTFAEYVSMNGIGRTNLVTESDVDGVSGWKGHIGAMTFEFQPADSASNPRASKLVSIAYAFNLQHTAALGPTLTRT